MNAMSVHNYNCIAITCKMSLLCSFILITFSISHLRYFIRLCSTKALLFLVIFMVLSSLDPFINIFLGLSRSYHDFLFNNVNLLLTFCVYDLTKKYFVLLLNIIQTFFFFPSILFRPCQPCFSQLGDAIIFKMFDKYAKMTVL